MKKLNDMDVVCDECGWRGKVKDIGLKEGGSWEKRHCPKCESEYIAVTTSRLFEVLLLGGVVVGVLLIGYFVVLM